MIINIAPSSGREAIFKKNINCLVGRTISLAVCVLLILTSICSVYTVYGEESLDKDHLPDGSYTLSGKLYKTDKKNLSMSNESLNPKVTLTVENGEYTVYLNFRGISMLGFFGYLGKLSYYKKGYTYDKYGNPSGSKAYATVLSVHRNSDGSVLVDSYNDAGSPYPKDVKFPLVNKASDNDLFVPLQVDVPIMEAIYPGTGIQDVLLKLDWNTLKEGGEKPVTETDIPDPSTVKVDKTKLKKIIKKAKNIKSSEYTTSSYKNMKTQLKKAQKVYKNKKATQTNVNNQVKALKIAINDLIKKASKRVNKENADSGRYTVYIDLWHATKDQASMGNAGLNRKAIIEVKDSKFVMYISVKRMTLGTITASLETIQIKNNSGGYTYGKVEERKIPGNRPSSFSFTLPSKDTFIPVKVDPKVSVMGNKPIDARLKIHWDTLEKASEDEKLSDELYASDSSTDKSKDKSDKKNKSTSAAALNAAGGAGDQIAGNSDASSENQGGLGENELLMIHFLGLIAVVGAGFVSTIISIRLKLLNRGFFGGI